MHMESNDNTQKLERKLSPLNVWALALGSIIGASAFLLPGNSFLGQAGPLGTAIAVSIGALVMIIISFNYDYMINKYPIAGGEFKYAQLAFGKKHGFVCSWFLALSYFAIVPVNATVLASIFRSLFGSVFQFGFHYSVSGYDVFLGEILLAMVPLILFALLSIRGVRFSGIFQTLLIFLLVGGVVFLSAAAFISGDASFANLTPAFSPDYSILTGILCVTVIAPYLFVGFDTVPQSAEEFNFSSRKTKVLMIVAVLVGALLYIALNTVTAMYVPEGYGNWSEYIRDIPNTSGIMSLPTFYTAKMIAGNFGLVVTVIATIAAALSGIVGFYMACSRLLYSMAKDNVIPASFGRLHEKYKTPYIAILFIMLISLIAPFFGRTAFGWLVEMSSVGAAIGYGYTSLAAFKYARKDNNRFILVTAILGSILAVIFLILLLIPIPVLNCSLGTEPYICLVAWIIIGLVFYLVSRK